MNASGQLCSPKRNIGLKKFKYNQIILNGISIFQRGPRKPFSGDIPEISDEKKKTLSK
jgi:hypothetical protein